MDSNSDEKAYSGYPPPLSQSHFLLFSEHFPKTFRSIECSINVPKKLVGNVAYLEFCQRIDVDE